MTAILVVLAVIVVLELVSVRSWRRDRPTTPPASHPAWTTGGLPSHPYAD
jgi:hypothetical protein